MAVEPKIAIVRILADLNLAVWYGIAIHTYNYIPSPNSKIRIWPTNEVINDEIMTKVMMKIMMKLGVKTASKCLACMTGCSDPEFKPSIEEVVDYR